VDCLDCRQSRAPDHRHVAVFTATRQARTNCALRRSVLLPQGNLDEVKVTAQCSNDAFLAPVAVATETNLAPLVILGTVFGALLSGDTPQSQRKPPQYVIRGGMASPQNLITGSTLVPGTNLSGFSVTSAPGMSVNQLAMAANYQNGQISYTTTADLGAIGVPVVPTPSDNNALHATAVVPVPLDPTRAAQISGVFTRIANPAKCGGGG
jgi:hypothetical protein